MAYKIKGVADIVFLMDATGSMQNCIDGVRESALRFFKILTKEGCDKTGLPLLSDWRAKVVGFRDAEIDGDNWIEDNAFTHDAAEIKRQFAALQATGGGDEPESLLDAIFYSVVAAKKSERGQEDPRAWRDYHDVKRFVIVFTDAPFKPKMTMPGTIDGDILLIRDVCMQERIHLYVVAPKGSPKYDCFEMIDAIRYARWIGVPIVGSNQPLEGLLNDVDAMNQLMNTISTAVRKTYTGIPDFCNDAGAEL